MGVGVGGSLTGMGGRYLLIDDPVKNRKEANSATYRQTVEEWYTSTFYTRLAPGGNILIVLTRWHEDDLAGRLSEKAKSDPNADQWTVITLPAVAEEPVAAYDPAGRARYFGRCAGTLPRCGGSGQSWVNVTGPASTSSGRRRTRARSSSGTTGATGSREGQPPAGDRHNGGFIGHRGGGGRAAG